jgi:hypothetical protein
VLKVYTTRAAISGPHRVLWAACYVAPVAVCACSLQVNIWRDGALHSLEVHLSTPHQLVPNHSHDVKPSYMIYAGLVFTPLTSWYLRR